MAPHLANRFNLKYRKANSNSVRIWAFACSASTRLNSSRTYSVSKHEMYQGHANEIVGPNVDPAEQKGGIRQWQVSRWGTRLGEPEKYRAMLYGAAYAKAMAEKNRTATKPANSFLGSWRYDTYGRSGPCR